MKKYIKSSNSGLLSVFWFDGENFYGPSDTRDGDTVESYGEYILMPQDHFDIWDKYKPKDCKEEYDYMPRGRISWNNELHKFIVVCDKKILDNEWYMAKVRYEYGLPLTTIFKEDEHYSSKLEI